MTKASVLGAVPAGKTPYTPEEIAEFQRAYDAGDWSGLVSIMDPYRMQASVEAAAVRGMEFERECEAESKKETRRFIVDAVAGIVSVMLILWVLAATFGPHMPQPDPSTVPHILTE